MTTFKQAVKAQTTQTTNGMPAFQSSLDGCVDLFYKWGGSRGKPITREFEKAFLENRDVALRVVQWGRDVRGGAGERELFRQVLKYLERYYPCELIKILDNIPEIGRWDDLLVFEMPLARNLAFAKIKAALEAGNGLCAKWMPRQGPKAVALRNYCRVSPKQWRKTLVQLTKVVEQQMCAKQWKEIDYSKVPSKAHVKYTGAFCRNDLARYSEYKAGLVIGETKVNASAVFPYEVINLLCTDQDLADAMWKALPNYLEGENKILPMVDVSGSMHCPVAGSNTVRCVDVAVSLGLYISERNVGPFQNLVATFSEYSKLIEIKGVTLGARKKSITSMDWGMNTNIHAAMLKILEVAQDNEVPQEEMPEILLILSDMQFDGDWYSRNARDMIQQAFTQAGYKAPKVVFWNLHAHDNVPARADDRDVALVSGFSPSIMKAVLKADTKKFTPLNVMLEAVMIDRYKLKELA